MLMTTEVPYVYSRDGIYYFTRRIPKDLQGHYRCPRIVLSLRTKSLRAAKTKSTTLAAQLDEEWMTLRWRSNDSPLRRYLSDQAFEARESSNAPLMTEARDIYLRSKGDGRPVTFSQAVDRAIGNLVDTVGNKPIDTYSRQDANCVRDALFERGLSKASVKRMFGTIRALVNFVTRELGLSDVSAFSGVYLGEDSQTETKRQPVPLKYIQFVQAECRKISDQGRWLIALISDSGMRLNEAVGLHKEDVQLDNEHPHVVLRPHPWRRLKTKGSERTIPLVGSALWAVSRAIEASSTEFLFPRYCDESGSKANSASAALNKWLSPRVPDGCVIHSFRHSFRDRLRAVECPQDIMDRLGGWSVDGVGETYGTGYPLEVLSRWMKKGIA
jgi:integrase